MPTYVDGEPTRTLAGRTAIAARKMDVVVLDGADRGASAPITEQGTRVGTAPSAQLRLSDPTVSRLHCQLFLRPEGVTVRDSGSTNGTWFSGARLHEADLAPDATLKVGGTTLRIRGGDEPVEIAISDRDAFDEVVGASVPMRHVYAIMERVAPTDATVLVQGDTGTGKELVARALHRASRRASGPFVAVDCGAIAPNVIESELFGHVRGAFSGAVADRKGLFEEAEAGTLFLDEIGELPLALQAKLLRTLETREIRRVGSNATRKIDVRLLAATNRSLAESVNDGSFREELYYRLAVVEVRLPPLHARREDIPMLAQRFYEQLTGDERPVPPELVSTLMTRSWPGNVRELRNFVERCVSLGLEERAASSAPRGLAPGLEAFVPVHMRLREAREAWMEQFEAGYARGVLAKTGGNVTRAAALAGVSRRFLQRMLARVGVRAAEDDEP
jgi:DNA-binding NtrC family response regulator